VVSIDGSTNRRSGKRQPWTANRRLESALDKVPADCGAAMELVGWALPSLLAEPIPSDSGRLAESSSPSSPRSPSSLLDLHLVQCDLPDLSVLHHLVHLKSLRIADCNVRDVPAREWTTGLTHLTRLQTLRLEALELDNAELHAIASSIGHVTDRISIGPLYNPRQFFSSLRTVVQECRCQTLELFGGGPKDSNLIHVVNGLLGRSKRPTKGSTINKLVVENFACSKALFGKLCRRLHHQSSTISGLRHFGVALARNSSQNSAPAVDLLPVVALLQSNTNLKGLSIDPSVQVDSPWRIPLLRAVQRNTHLEELNGFVMPVSKDVTWGDTGAAPEQQASEETRWSDQLAFCLELNRCGRRALDLPAVRANPAMLPHVLRHVLKRSSDPNVVLYFLKASHHHWQKC
jgi:hypothetical protein